MFRGFIKTVAPPAIANRLVGEWLNGKPVFTSAVRAVISLGGLALVQTRRSWYLVVFPAAPTPEAAHGG